MSNSGRKKSISLKHKLFIKGWLQTGDKTKAYHEIYPNCKDPAACAIRLTKRPELIEYYKELKAMAEKKVDEALAISLAWSKEKAMRRIMETMEKYDEFVADIQERNKGVENRDFINPLTSAYSKTIYDGVAQLNELTGINREVAQSEEQGSLAAQILACKPQKVDDMNIENYTAPNIGGEK